MQDHSTSDIAAFLADPGFAAWVKYGEQHEYWTSFLEAHPYQKEVVEQAVAIILAAASMPLHYPEEAERRQMWAHINNTIQAETVVIATAPASETPVLPLRRSRRYGWWAAAAAVVAGCIAAPFFLQRHGKVDNYAILLRKAGLSADHRTEARNEGNKPLWVSLPDGSSAVLAPGGRLTYADDFTTKEQREVYLSGAAFFEVQKKATHPFVVYASTLAIKVLGTSFSVTAPNDKPEVQVQVKSGKVLLYTGAAANSLVVNARQKAALSNGQLQLTEKTEETPSAAPVAEVSALTAAEQVPLTFEDAAIPDVFSTLEEAYGIHINYDKEKLGHCRLTASLSDEPLPEKIRMICKAIGAPYEINGSEVTVRGKRCN